MPDKHTKSTTHAKSLDYESPLNHLERHRVYRLAYYGFNAFWLITPKKT